jgi:hypothetical protein
MLVFCALCCCILYGLKDLRLVGLLINPHNSPGLMPMVMQLAYTQHQQQAPHAAVHAAVHVTYSGLR